MLFEVLKLEFAKSTILYVGYSHRDPNWKTLLSELRAEFYPSTPPPAFRVVPETDPLDREILKSQGVETIDGTLASLRMSAEVPLKSAKLDTEGLGKYRGIVPNDLANAFAANPAATIRLLKSWEYLNQVPLSGPPNFKAFLAGDGPNWKLISDGLVFERDVEPVVLEELLDFATSENPGRPTHLILGAAGNGVTTAVMSLALRLIREKAGAVLVHKSWQPLNDADVEFAASVITSPVFFVVDNAADFEDKIGDTLIRLREAKRAACFLLGDRPNEWRQQRPRFRPEEYPLESLSDAEVHKLLTFLEKHQALGALLDLEPELRVAAIKNKHEKQLLVALRELTEGKAFDAIIEDEYRAIKDEVPRRLYATVCVGYHLRRLVRDSLLSAVLRMSLPDLYTATTAATEGVVQFVEIDETRGLYAAKARHQVIAEIVWEKCVSQAERDELVLRVLDGLNLTYTVDVQLFDSLIRSDRQVESISTIDGKMRYFETACRKAPDSAYVRQHYARMLLRESKPDAALSEIDRAIAMSPRLRVLHHTRGLVLMELALTAPGMEIARRRLAQSEASFRQAKALGRTDPHPYQGLAQLYLGWAKRAESQEEIAEYVAKAEEVIGEGLREAQDRESLWIESAELQQWVGNRPATLEALKKAVLANPKGSVGRYLLGRAYLHAGKAKDAVDVLLTALQNDPNEFRSAVACARAMVELGEPYKKAIAILKLASLYGMRDPRFIATLGGMLILDGQAAEGERLFAESTSRDTFSFTELHRVAYKPIAPGKPGTVIRLEGEVVSVRASYAFVQPPGYPAFFCRGSKFGGLLMRRGLRVAFTAAFSARGPVAEGLVAL